MNPESPQAPQREPGGMLVDKTALLQDVNDVLTENTEAFNNTVTKLMQLHLQRQREFIQGFVNSSQVFENSSVTSLTSFNNLSMDSSASSISFNINRHWNPSAVNHSTQEWVAAVAKDNAAPEDPASLDFRKVNSDITGLTTLTSSWSEMALRPAPAEAHRVEQAIAPLRDAVRRLEKCVEQLMPSTGEEPVRQLGDGSEPRGDGVELHDLRHTDSNQDDGETDMEEEEEKEEIQHAAASGWIGIGGKEVAALSRLQLTEEDGSLSGQVYSRFRRHIDWWFSLEEPERSGSLAEFVLSSKLETLIVLVILLNMVFMWIVTNREIQDPDAEWDVERPIDRFFVCFFLTELLLKISVHRQYYFCNEAMAWNLFDFLLVVASIVEQVMLTGGEGTGQMPIMRLLRTFKLAKVLRGARLMRFFSQLSLMLNSLLGSLTTLFWSFVMLALLFFLFGLVMVQGISGYIRDSTNLDPDLYAVLMEFYGTIEITMLTLYKTTMGGDDWSLFYRPIAATGAVNAAFFILFVAVMQIAMMNILTGIFVECAMKLAMPDKDAQAMASRVEKIEDRQDFVNLYREIQRLHPEPDGDDSRLSKAAFLTALKTGRFLSHMEILGIWIKDSKVAIERFFPKKAERINPSQFVDACFDLRGQASSVDLHELMLAVSRIKDRMHTNHRRQLTEMRRMRRRQASTNFIGMLRQASDAPKREQTKTAL